MLTPILASASITAAGMTSSNAEETVLLHAAGSLRDALSDVAKQFEVASGGKVIMNYGASGTLKEAIAGGERAEVFASANMEHPQALAKAGKSGPVVLFARNRLCVLTKPGLAVTTATLLDRMLDANVKVGTSTPKADPSGDYAFEVFAKSEKLKAGSRAILETKALQLAGNVSAPQVPAGKSLYGMLIAEGKADLFLTYCTGAIAAQQEYPDQQVVHLPDNLAVGADYGLTVMADSSPAAYRLAMSILAPGGQRTLTKYGFSAPWLPAA
jgi:molybdate transport system substrate-binding protein